MRKQEEQTLVDCVVVSYRMVVMSRNAKIIRYVITDYYLVCAKSRTELIRVQSMVKLEWLDRSWQYKDMKENVAVK